MMIKALDHRKAWQIGGIVAAVLIIAASWFMLIGPALSDTDDQHAAAASTRQQNALLTQKVRTLQLKKSHLRTYTASLQKALELLPYDSGLPAFTRQITQQAKTAGVTIVSITVGEPTPLTPAAAPASTPDGAAATTPAPAPTTAAAAPASGLYAVQVTVNSTGPMARQIALLKSIQSDGPRLALITGTQFGAGPNGGAKLTLSSTATTQLTVFSAPQTPDQVAVLNKLLAGDFGN